MKKKFYFKWKFQDPETCKLESIFNHTWTNRYKKKVSRDQALKDYIKKGVYIVKVNEGK